MTAAQRTITPLGLVRLDGWRFKAYSISTERTLPNGSTIAAALEAAAADLRQAHDHAEVGFLGLYRGPDTCRFFVDWWEAGSELRHHVYRVTEKGWCAQARSQPIASIWELAVLAHERNSWVRHVQSCVEPSFDRYLEDQLKATL